ncbi:hypothetical protein C8R44DRAFT_747987 [Mycena epipterygia]|nr:hypothetical protein C8R44DRAFT_747987 [Mycena epipterygia]
MACRMQWLGLNVCNESLGTACQQFRCRPQRHLLVRDLRSMDLGDDSSPKPLSKKCNVRARSSEMPNEMWELDARKPLGTCLEILFEKLHFHRADEVRSPNKTTPTSGGIGFHTSAIRLCHNVTALTHGRARLCQLRLRPPLREPESRSASHGRALHLLSVGICASLEAALGMESGLMGKAARLLALSEAGARKATADAKMAKTAGGCKGSANGRGDGGGRFTPDAIVLLGLTHALSESAILHELLPMHGLEHPSALYTPYAHGPPRRCMRAWEHGHAHCPVPVASRCLTQEEAERCECVRPAEGPAFGFGLFNFMFSLLPKKVQSYISLLGFKHDCTLVRVLAAALFCWARSREGSLVSSGLVVLRGLARP